MCNCGRKKVYALSLVKNGQVVLHNSIQFKDLEGQLVEVALTVADERQKEMYRTMIAPLESVADQVFTHEASHIANVCRYCNLYKDYWHLLSRCPAREDYQRDFLQAKDEAAGRK